MAPKSKKAPVPTEADEQMLLFKWAELESGAIPELKLLYHIPNGGSRHPAEAARLKAQGVHAGVPDLCLPVPRGDYHGLYIELKRQKGGRVSPRQAEWIETLIHQGYCAAICHGWEDAREQILAYMQRTTEVLTMANERRLISVCGECSNYNWKKHRCTVCSCKESDPRNPFYDDCPLPKGVEVCYCKDCKHAKELGEAEKKIYLAECLICTSSDATIDGYNIVMPDHFCSYGERKSGTQPQREDV